MNYFLLPGNPPAAHFYELWGKEIVEQHPDARVMVSHYPDLKYFKDSNFAMTEVLGHHLDQLKKFSQKVGAPVTIVGHSLGAYFALGLMELVPELVHQGIFLHPFLRRPGFSGRLTLEAVSSFANSHTIQTAVLRSRKALEYFSADLTFVTREEILRSFQLARHERATIGRDIRPVIIPNNLRDKIHVYYHCRDTWCGMDLVSELKRQIAVSECAEPHGFITTEKHRRSLFQSMTKKYPA